MAVCELPSQGAHLSPELELAIADAALAEYKGPEYIRGLLAVGPQFRTHSDELAKLIAEARLQLAATHYAPDPREQRRQLVTYRGREAERRRYPQHGRAEFLKAIA